jgi:EAL domain-containing protein (putative c-di-GMP-specific phosphodiesterase class I)
MLIASNSELCYAKFVMPHALTEKELFINLKKNNFILYYQPKLDLKTRKVVSYEALLRLQHPVLGFLQPESFIPLAEQSDLILELTDWVINQVVVDYQNFFYDIDVTISINLSAKQLTSDILNHKIFNNYNNSFEFEITESRLINNIQHVAEIISKLRAKGFKFALDDFGRGFASLDYLRCLPVDIIKLDKVFIKNIHNFKDRIILDYLIKMFHALNLTTVAEGVETTQQLSFLEKINCDIVQGYLISEPLALEKIKYLVREI